MRIEELEAQLVAAREAHTAALKAYRSVMGSDIRAAMQTVEARACDVSRAMLLEAERALAAARNEEHAEPIDFPVQWDVGAPLPHLVMNDHRCFLAFYDEVFGRVVG